MDKISNMEEIDHDTLQGLEEINDSLENKILNYTSIIKNMDYKIKSFDDAILSIEKRKISLENASKRMKEIVKFEMERCNKKKIENNYHEISLVLNNPKVVIVNECSIPEEYMRHKVKETIEPDKEAISKALKDGINVPGTIISRETRISIK
jgi:hypothetical protein